MFTVPQSPLHTISFPMLSENSWAQVHQNKRHPSDTNSFDFGLGCPVACSRPTPHPIFLSGSCCPRARTDLPPASPPFSPEGPLREAHGTTGEETKRFDGEEDHVQSRRHSGKRRHSKVTCRHKKDVTCKGDIMVKATIVILSTYNAQR